MKNNFQRITSLFLVFVTLFNTVISPLTVQADTNTSNKGDLRVVTSSGTTTGDSVSITTGTNSDGSLVKNGDISITKTVSKTNVEGRYKVQFTVKGKDVKNEISTTKDVYVVVVLDKSSSVAGIKWRNAKNGAKTFATSLLKNVKNAKIALVTFSGLKNDEEVCNMEWVKDNYSIFGGHFETKCTYNLYNDATVVRNFQNTDFKDVEFGSAIGSTNLGEGLNKALNLFNNTTIPSDAFKYVVVLSDGKPTFYTNSNGYTEGTGINMTSETEKYAIDMATALKNKGVEIFSIRNSVVNDSTAEKVLKNVASVNKNTTTIKHYFTAEGFNESSVASSFNDVATSISYDYAGKNATINDNIGSNFTLTSGTNTINIGNITEDGITTEPFYIDIDPDSKTGWHQTNTNFTLSYTKPNGTISSITCDKNPEIYWIQNEYDYRIEYYYDGNIDTSLTETGKAFKDTKIEVSDTTINEHLKTGYEFVKVEPSKREITISSTLENNVIKVYYQKAKFNYKIYYVEKDNKNNILDSIQDSAIYQNEISVSKKDFMGFTYDSMSIDTNTFKIDANDENNIIYVYYTRNNYPYTIYHVEKDNSDNILEIEESSAKYQDEILVSKKDFNGFIYDSKDTDTIIINNEKNIAYVYYTRASYSYTIRHLEKDNLDNVLDINKGTAEFEEKISVKQKKFTGFTYYSQDKEKIEITSSSDLNNACIYYTRNSYPYTIYHVEKGNEENILDTIQDSAIYQAKVLVEEEDFSGYIYDSKDTDTIIINTEKNVAYVYYTKNNYDYTIYHVEKDNPDNILEIEENNAKYQDEILVKEKDFTGYTYDSKDTDTIKIDTEINIAFVYYTRNKYNYTIEHYLETKDGSFSLKEKEEVKDVEFESNVVYKALEFAGYKYDATRDEAVEKVLEDNIVVRLYYVLADSNVTVHYVVKVDDNYISFDKYGRDEFGNITEDFKDVDLLDDILTGKIGTNFTTKYREVKNYNFIGIYEGNILENSNIEKLDGTTITGEFDFKELEYTYVYEAPLGGDEIPPQTGFESNLSYLSYVLLVAVIYVLKKYFDLISEK